MPAANAGGGPAEGGGAITGILQETRSLVKEVGPEWGLALVIAIFLFLPRYGVIVHLASLFKEDRADARKQKVESERLLTRYRNRPKLPAKKKEEEQG